MSRPSRIQLKTSTGPATFADTNTFTVTISPSAKTEEMYVKDGGVFKKGVPYVKSGGVFVEADAYVLSGGVWTQVHEK